MPAAPLIELVRKDSALAHALHAKIDSHFENEANGTRALAVRTGINEASIRDILRGRASTVSLDLADRYLCATGRHLRDLWPWLYTPEQVEADLAASEGSARGLELSHRSTCATGKRHGCTCEPSYTAIIRHKRKRYSRTFARKEDALAWRQEWLVEAGRA